MSLTWKIRAAAALLVGGLALVIGLFFWNTRRMATAASWVEHTRAVQTELEAILGDVYTVESSTRGYVITGREVFLAPAQSARDELRVHLATLEHLVADNPTQAARVPALREDVQHKMAFSFDTAALMRAGRADAARDLVATARGMQLSDEVRRRVVAMRSDEERLMHERVDALRASDHRSVWVGGVLILVLAAAGVAFSLHLRHLARERARAAEAARLVEERLGLLVDSVRDYAILSLDEGGRITGWNPGAERIKGYTRDEAIGRHFSMFYDPADVAAGRPDKELETARREGRYEEEGVRVRKDGSRFFAHVILTPIRAGGRVIGFAKITQDVSERRRTEEERQQLIERLQRSNGELQDFAMVASHDLQEPLRKIQMFGERLAEQYNAVLDERGRDYLRRMQNAAERGRVLIQGLLAYSRVTTKAQPPVPVDLNTVAREVVGDLEARISSAGGRVELDALPTVDADPLQIRQLLQNLIGNALKFHREDAPPVIRVRATPKSGSNGHSTWSIEVSDNGIGFEQKYVDRIFKLFQRLHERGAYEGAGMGLAICRKIVERHHGTISARSAPGEGATFVVELPAHQPKEIAA